MFSTHDIHTTTAAHQQRIDHAAEHRLARSGDRDDRGSRRSVRSLIHRLRPTTVTIRPTTAVPAQG